MPPSLFWSNISILKVPVEIGTIYFPVSSQLHLQDNVWHSGNDSGGMNTPAVVPPVLRRGREGTTNDLHVLLTAGGSESVNLNVAAEEMCLSSFWQEISIFCRDHAVKAPRRAAYGADWWLHLMSSSEQGLPAVVTDSCSSDIKVSRQERFHRFIMHFLVSI